MRASWDGNALFSNEAGAFIGIGFGADFTAEHEHGIPELKRNFGLPPKPTRDCYGADARTITIVPAQLHYLRLRKWAYLIYNPYWTAADREKLTPKYCDMMMDNYNPEHPLATAWSDRDFGVRVLRPDIPRLTELHQAFLNRDIMFLLAYPDKMRAFSNPGLTILIRSRVDQADLQSLADKDLEHIVLMEAVEATGIEARLKTAGRRYFALAPRWVDDNRSELEFFLNPWDQHENNDGWFTLQDLEDWIRGEGKIPKATANKT